MLPIAMSIVQSGSGSELGRPAREHLEPLRYTQSRPPRLRPNGSPSSMSHGQPSCLTIEVPELVAIPIIRFAEQTVTWLRRHLRQMRRHLLAAIGIARPTWLRAWCHGMERIVGGL